MNNFAASSADIGIALQKSASALYGANNSLTESIALIASGQEVVQNAETLGTQLKTISARIRGTTDQLGEDAEEMTMTTSEIRDKIKGLTGIDVMESENSFKSTFQILKEIAEVYDTLTDTQKASVGEILGGKLGLNVVQSILGNFETAKEIVEELDSGLAEGSATKELEKSLDSIQTKLNQLQSTWQQLAVDAIETDVVKGAVDLIKGLLENLDKIFKTLSKIKPLVITLATTLVGNKLLTNQTGSGFLSFKGETLNSGVSLFKGIQAKEILSLAEVENQLAQAQNAKSLGVSQLNALPAINENIREYVRVTDEAAISAESFYASQVNSAQGILGTIQAIRTYNNISEEDIATRQAFAQSIRATNSVLGEQLTNLNGANASLSSYIANLIKAKASEMALSVVTGLMNVGISLVISAIVQGIAYLAQSYERMQEKNKELAESLKETNSKLKEQDDNINSLVSQYSEIIVTTSDLSTEQGRLTEIQKSLTEAFGDSATGIDLLNKSYAENIALIQQQRKEAAKEFVNDKSNENNYNDAKKFLTQEGRISENMGILSSKDNATLLRAKGVKSWGIAGIQKASSYNKYKDNISLSNYSNVLAVTGTVEEQLTVLNDLYADLSDLWSDKGIESEEHQWLKSMKERIGELEDQIAENKEYIENYKGQITLSTSIIFDDNISREDIEKQLEIYSEGGNVDLKVRPVIDAKLLEQAGWENAGKGAATLFTSTFSDETGNIAVNFTPIITDEKGNFAEVMTPEDLQKYAEDVIAGCREDDLNLKIGATFEGEDAIQQAETTAQYLHALHEKYFLDDGTSIHEMNEEITSDLNNAESILAKLQVAEKASDIIELSSAYAELKNQIYSLVPAGETSAIELINSFFDTVEKNVDQSILNIDNKLTVFQKTLKKYEDETYSKFTGKRDKIDTAAKSISIGDSIDAASVIDLIEADSDLLGQFKKTADGYTVSIDALTASRKKLIEKQKDDIKKEIAENEKYIEDQEAILEELNRKLSETGGDNKQTKNKIKETEENIESAKESTAKWNTYLTLISETLDLISNKSDDVKSKFDTGVSNLDSLKSSLESLYSEDGIDDSFFNDHPELLKYKGDVEALSEEIQKLAKTDTAPIISQISSLLYQARKSGNTKDIEKYTSMIKILQDSSDFESTKEIAQQKKLLNDQIDAKERYITFLERQKDKEQDILDSLNDQKDALEDIIADYETAAEAAKSAIDEEIDALEKNIDGINDKIDAKEDEIDIKNDEIDALEDEKTAIEDAYEAELALIEDKIDALEDEKDSLNDLIDAIEDQIAAIDAEADALAEAAKEQELLDDLKEKELALDKAKSNRIRVYDSTRGWRIEQNSEEVAIAQKEYDEALKNYQDYLLEKDRKQRKAALEEQKKQIQEQQDLIDKEIEGLEKEKEALEAAKDAKIEIIDKKIEAINIEIDAINEEIDALNEEIDAIEESKDKWEEYKDLWDDVLDSYQNAQDEMTAAAILGNDWRSKIAAMDMEILDNYSTAYNDYQTQLHSILEPQIEDYENLIDAYDDQIDKQNDLKSALESYLGFYDTYSEKFVSLTDSQTEAINKLKKALEIGDSDGALDAVIGADNELAKGGTTAATSSLSTKVDSSISKLMNTMPTAFETGITNAFNKNMPRWVQERNYNQQKNNNNTYNYTTNVNNPGFNMEFEPFWHQLKRSMDKIKDEARTGS